MTNTTSLSTILGTSLALGCIPGFVVNLLVAVVIICANFFQSQGCGNVFRLSLSLIAADTLHLSLLLFYLAPASIVQDWLVPDGWLRETPGKLIRVSWYAMEIMLCNMSVNRYVAVCRPNEYSIWYSDGRTKLAIIITWLLGILICIVGEVVAPCCALYLYYGSYSYGYLGNDFNYNHTYVTRSMDISTSIIVVLLHALVVRNIRASSTRVAENLASDTLERRRRREVRYAIQLLIVSSIFLSVWILFDLLNRLIQAETAPIGTYLFVPIIQLFNGSSNGFVLLFLNKEVKKEVKALFASRAQTSQRKSPNDASSAMAGGTTTAAMVSVRSVTANHRSVSESLRG